jgi:hypothetical protein
MPDRHPENKHGYGSPEFWADEYRLYQLTREEYHSRRMAEAGKCEVCGTPRGYSFGTGDCGCDISQE